MKVTSAVANPFLGKDGLLQISALNRLQARIEKELKGEEIKNEVIYIYSAKVKPVNYRVSAEKSQDFKHLTMRAFKVGVRKRLTPATLNKNKILLTVPVRGSLSPDLQKLVTAANRAIKSHITKSEKVREKIAKEKAKNREASNKVFDQSLSLLGPKLLSAGIKERDMVEAQGMFGKTLIVKLSANNYISVGKSDAKRFRDARKEALSK